MTTPTRLLDEAFQNSLATAATMDEQGIAPEDTQDFFPDRTPTNVELVQASLDFYNEHHIVMDRAIQGALNLLNSPDGAARVNAMQAAVEASDYDSLRAQASEMMSSDQFGFKSAAEGAQALLGFGMGVSAGVSAVVGLLAGADLVVESDQVIERVWKGGSFKGGLSISGGLELSFWVNTPLTGGIGGWLHDVYALEYALPCFIRFMYIKQRETGATSSTFAGVSLQFPLGWGFPIREYFGKDPKAVAGWIAQQDAVGRPTLATLTVINKATGVDTIPVQQTAILTATLTNTSGANFSLASGATIKIKMPAYFTQSDISNMTTSLPGWTLTNDGSNLTLTATTTFNWANGSDIVLGIGNVYCSNTPAKGQQSTPGFVKITVDQKSFDTPILTSASFDLVWANSEATLKWQTNVIAPYTPVGMLSGAITAYAQPGTDVMTLTTATDSNSDVWVLGYIYNYNTSNPNQTVPQVAAAWWKQGAPKTGSNFIVGNWVNSSSPSPTTTCFNSSGSSIVINVSFNS